MKRRFAWLGVMGLLLTACDDVQIRESETGYRGAARVNPYLAAERFLEHEDVGFETETSPAWPHLDYSVAMVVMPSSELESDGMVRSVEEWVKEGGHFVCLVDGGESTINDWSSHSPQQTWPEAFQSWIKRLGLKAQDGTAYSAKPAGTLVPKPTPAGATPSPTPSPTNQLSPKKSGDVHEVKIGDETFLVELPGEARLVAEKGTKVEVATGGTDPRVLVLKRGDGYITFLSQARPLRNRFLDRYDHASFLHTLASWARDGRIIFVRGAGMSFWAMVWKHGWPVVIGLFVVLLLWLWKHMTRFGPVVQAEGGDDPRAYLGHLESVGGYAWRMDHGGELLTLLRTDAMERYLSWQRRSGAWDADVFEVIAQRAGCSREDAMRAMTAMPTRDAGQFTRMVAILQQVRWKL